MSIPVDNSASDRSGVVDLIVTKHIKEEWKASVFRGLQECMPQFQQCHPVFQVKMFLTAFLYSDMRVSGCGCLPDGLQVRSWTFYPRGEAIQGSIMIYVVSLLLLINVGHLYSLLRLGLFFWN